MIQKEILHKVNDFTFDLLKNEATGHDYYHILRVVKNVKIICEAERHDETYPLLLAYLHDVGDYKLHEGEDKTSEMVIKALSGFNLEKSFINQVILDIKAIGFKGGFNQASDSKAVWIVQDADRLDAIGAIGIARAFAYGGSKGRLLHDPEHLSNDSNYIIKSEKDYKNAKSPTIQHFYDKLLQLKDLMNTAKGKAMAMERHQFMESYLKQFYKEWNE